MSTRFKSYVYKQMSAQIFELVPQDLLKFFLYGSDKICWLCTKTILYEPICYSIHDDVFIITESFQLEATFGEILKGFASNMINLNDGPSKLCSSCASQIIKQHIFANHCKQQFDNWQNAANAASKMFINENNPTESDDSEEEPKVIPFENFKLPDIVEDGIMNKPMITCPHCYDKIKYGDYKKHAYEVHASLKYLSCKGCGRCFVHPASLSVHKEKCNKQKKAWRCRLCRKLFLNERQRLLHYKYVCKPIRCKFCRQLVNKKFLQSHYKKCSKENKYKRLYKYQCKNCKLEFDTNKLLKKHIHNNHTERNIPCPTCSKLFKTSDAVQRHLTVHTEEKNFTCPTCGKKFVAKRTLENHLRLHSGERPYTCFFCEESFVSNSRRLEHLRRKHWEPQYECEKCHKKFSRQSVLNKHLKLYCRLK